MPYTDSQVLFAGQAPDLDSVIDILCFYWQKGEKKRWKGDGYAWQLLEQMP